MKQIEFEGTTHQFPDDFTDADISAALASSPAAAPPAPQGTGVMDALGTALGNRAREAAAFPQKAAQKIADVVTTNPLDLIPKKPPLSAALPMLLPGGGSVVTRLGAIGAGKMLEAPPSASPTENLKTAAKGIVGNPNEPLSMLTSPAAFEAYSPVLSAALRITPGGKARINEGQSQDLLGTIGRTNRVAREAIEAAPVSELQREPRTAAAIKRGFESGAVSDAASQRFDATLNRVAAAAGNPAINTPALQEAYAMMPPLEQRLLGPLAPGGFTLQQAQQVRSWVGDPAFAQSTLGQGVRKVPQQRLWGEITQEIEGSLAHAPRALQLWQANNGAYGGTQALQDALTQPNAFTRRPNQLLLDRSALSDTLAKNEVDYVRRMGRAGYDYLVNRVLGGAQPGTRDIVASGSGGAADAFMSWLRGQNTGSTQAARIPIATAAPNIGSQYTGRQPYPIPPRLQAILDVAGPRALSGERR